MARKRIKKNLKRKKMKSQSKYIILLVCILAMCSCKETPTPKPRGYFRIDLPNKEYVSSQNIISDNKTLPLSFEYPKYGSIELVTDKEMEPGWFNISFPQYKAKIYFTYKDVNNNLDDLMEQAYKFNVKNHIIKADAINEQLISNPEEDVYGMLYNLKGSTATAVQFFVTDSIKHFFRGSLYFESEPNQDSLAPVINFFEQDIEHLIETLKWDDKK